MWVSVGGCGCSIVVCLCVCERERKREREFCLVDSFFRLVSGFYERMNGTGVGRGALIDCLIGCAGPCSAVASPSTSTWSSPSSSVSF